MLSIAVCVMLLIDLFTIPRQIKKIYKKKEEEYLAGLNAPEPPNA